MLRSWIGTKQVVLVSHWQRCVTWFETVLSLVESLLFQPAMGPVKLGVYKYHGSDRHSVLYGEDVHPGCLALSRIDDPRKFIYMYTCQCLYTIHPCELRRPPPENIQENLSDSENVKLQYLIEWRWRLYFRVTSFHSNIHGTQVVIQKSVI